jgi:hypothetical protein
MRRRLLLALVLLGLLLGLLLGFGSAKAEPIALPQAALLPSASPLCNSSLVPCLDIDDLAAHAYAHLIVLPKTELRSTTVTIPYGLSIGLFGRLSGGLSSHTSFFRSPARISAAKAPFACPPRCVCGLCFPFIPLLRPRFAWASPTITSCASVLSMAQTPSAYLGISALFA